jgi:hypothetical protein
MCSTAGEDACQVENADAGEGAFIRSVHGSNRSSACRSVQFVEHTLTLTLSRKRAREERDRSLKLDAFGFENFIESFHAEPQTGHAAGIAATSTASNTSRGAAPKVSARSLCSFTRAGD